MSKDLRVVSHIASPQELASLLHRLPPILNIDLLTPMQNYSKGARGLLV